MAYRGEDLDLRTPQGWSSSNRDTGGEQPNWWTRSAIYKGGRADPLWVDDNVMACCNHAYDLAVAHRAPEVRLEHLINALTLSDAAAQVLEARGLSLASLRRESGATIANDLPAAAGAHTVPKRSEALEETLRLAADRAYPRRTPVTVDDLLHVLFDMRRDLPGAHLLHRHTSTLPGSLAGTHSGRNGVDHRPDLRLEPLPHLARPTAEPRYTPAPTPRYASPSAHDYFSQPARDPIPPTREASREAYRETVREPVRETMRENSRTLREAPATVDNVQNNRIESLERMVRDLGIDLAADRKSLQSLVSDLHRTTSAQADDSGRFRGNLSDRLTALEDTIVRSHNETASLPSALMDRISLLERSIETRMADVSRSSATPQILLDRLAAIERNIEIRLTEVGRASSAPQALFDRLAAIEHGVEARLTDIARISMQTVERLQAIEHASHRPVEATLSPLVSLRLDSITSFGSKIEGLERTFQVILDRLTGLERKISTPQEMKAIDLAPVQARLADIERNVINTVQQSTDLSPVTDLLSGMEARVAGLERTLENRSSETGRTVSFIGDRLRGFEEAIGGQRSQLTDRLAQLERALTAFAESSVTNGNGHENELTEVHEALLKLNANQQTLAGSLDQWRLDSTGDLSVISNRLKVIEEADRTQNPRIEALAEQLTTVHASLAKKEVRKARFRHWLFGTDEWYSASYHTNDWRTRQSGQIGASQNATENRPLARPLMKAAQPTPPAPPPSVFRR